MRGTGETVMGFAQENDQVIKRDVNNPNDINDNLDFVKSKFNNKPLKGGDEATGDSEPNLSDDEDGDYRIYELRYGAKVYLNFFAKTFYTNGKMASEGTCLNGYKVGIWRFYNENGLLVSIGRYNKKNERWGKWTYYKELEGKSCIYMSCDIRGNREKYWRYDMDGKLLHEHTIFKALGEMRIL